jgi:hypothetical protein
MTSVPSDRHALCDCPPSSRDAHAPRDPPRDRAASGALVALESQLTEPATAHWPPVGFYLTFYIVAGTTIGILGSLASFIFHVVGSLLVNQDPLKFLRVYGTVFLGARALTTEDLNFFMLVAVVHFSLGAIAGAVFHVLVNRFVPDRTGLRSASASSTVGDVDRELLLRAVVAAATPGQRSLRASS